jgi:hypothetical protein
VIISILIILFASPVKITAKTTTYINSRGLNLIGLICALKANPFFEWVIVIGMGSFNFPYGLENLQKMESTVQILVTTYNFPQSV